MKLFKQPALIIKVFLIYAKAILFFTVGLYFFILPSIRSITLITSKQLKTGQIHPYYFQLHQKLTENYQKWLTERLVSNRATELSVHDISGTEWPLFGTAFYLWSTESLQKAWEQNRSLAPHAPREYASESITLAAKLLTDPKQAHWVKLKWGDDYLKKENLFYRMLLISGLTSYQKLSGNQQYRDMLADQVNSLAREIDQSPYGLLDDYPGECYPIDILPAIVAIKKADALLGIDHAEFIARARRGFQSAILDPETKLPAYICDSKKGIGIGPARGTGISYMLMWAPELWPEIAQDWYGKYEDKYWQRDWFLAGWREFAKNSHNPNWYLEVDAGPVIAGYGTAASAFGLGAALVNGRMDQAYPLLAESLIFSWPLPNETFLTPKLLSNLSDAPFLGESALLFVLTRVSSHMTNNQSTHMPGSVVLILTINFLIGVILILFSLKSLKRDTIKSFIWLKKSFSKDYGESKYRERKI